MHGSRIDCDDVDAGRARGEIPEIISVTTRSAEHDATTLGPSHLGVIDVVVGAHARDFNEPQYLHKEFEQTRGIS